jgi:hypothetical protein
MKRMIVTLLGLAFVTASQAGKDYIDTKATATASIAPRPP